MINGKWLTMGQTHVVYVALNDYYFDVELHNRAKNNDFEELIEIFNNA